MTLSKLEKIAKWLLWLFVLSPLLFFVGFVITVEETKPPAIANAQDLKETMAIMLNLNGLLCAKVTSVRPLILQDQYEVTCIEYRGGKAQVSYILNAKTGRAFKI